MAKDTRYVGGARKLARRIQTIRRNTQLPPLLDEIGGLLLRRTLDRFDKEVAPDGTPWAPLAPATLERRKRLGYENNPKLVRTQTLRNSIQLIKGDVTESVFTNTGAGVRIGVQDPEVAAYASVQNNGNTRIPARRFLGVSALDVRAVDGFLRRRARKIELQAGAL